MAEPSVVYIHASAALGPNRDYLPAQRVRLSADPTPSDLRELTRRVLGQSLRQASHFVELAAIGARLCLERAGQAPPPATAVYLGTGLAEVRAGEALFKQVLPPGPGLASPFDFINATNNMAAFYVARLAGLVSRNLTLTLEQFSFEAALYLAWQDLRHGAVPAALVGGVDENSFPRANHLRLLPLRDDQVMGEGSAWLYLNGDPDGAIGEVLCVETLKTDGLGGTAWAQALRQFVGAQFTPTVPVSLLPGYGLAPEETEALTRALPGVMLAPYLDYCGCYPTAAAFGVALQFDVPPAAPQLWLHVNRDRRGQTRLIGVRRPAGC